MDLYERRARLAPALIVVFPIAANIAAWFPNGIVGWAGFWSLVTLSGGTLFMAQIARELGSRLEGRLFSSWGGNPAVQALRYQVHDQAAVGRRHAKLQSLMGNFQLPTAEEELSDPAGANALYEQGVLFLRSQTRDQSRFGLLHHENCNYGFWRNLLGLRSIGCALSAIAAAVMAMGIIADGWHLASPMMLIACLINTLLLVGWLIIVTPTTVHTAARSYADRLMESIELL